MINIHVTKPHFWRNYGVSEFGQQEEQKGRKAGCSISDSESHHCWSILAFHSFDKYLLRCYYISHPMLCNKQLFSMEKCFKSHCMMLQIP